MSELGDMLRGTREKQGLTLADLQAKTKIQKRYLQAIEDGDYGQLPGKFYARAFIRRFAEALALDPDPLFETYAKDIPGSDGQWQNPPSELTNHEIIQGAPRSRRSTALPKILTGILIIGLLVAIWFVIQHYSGHSGTGSEHHEKNAVGLSENTNLRKNQHKQDKQHTSDQKAPRHKSKRTEQKLEKTSVEGNLAHYTLKHTNMFKLKLSITGSGSWIELRRSGEDGNAYAKAMYYKGKTITHDFSKDKKVYLSIGSASNVDVKINGKSFTYPNHNTSQRFLFTKKGEKEH